MLHTAAGGFPLHLVEAVRRDPDGERLTAGSPDLMAVLRGRFDALGPECRAVVELASAVGREFRLDLLCAASDLPPQAVVEAVDELWRLRILAVQHDRYDFSHDLLRRAAYEQLTPPARWLLHQRLATALEQLHAHDLDPVAGRLADQYARAGSPDRACELFHRAAVLADDVFAYSDAVELFGRSLGLLADLPPGAGRDAREIRSLTGLARALNASRGYSDPDLADALSRVVALAEQAAMVPTTVDALVGLWAARFVQGDILRAHEIAVKALALSESVTDPGAAPDLLRAQAHFAGGGSTLSLGRPADSLAHFDAGHGPGRRRGVPEHRQPPRRARPGLVGARALAAGQPGHRARVRGGGHRPGPRPGPPLHADHHPRVRRADPPAARPPGGPAGLHRRARGGEQTARVRLLRRLGRGPGRVERRRRLERPAHAGRDQPAAPRRGVRADAVLARACWPTARPTPTGPSRSSTPPRSAPAAATTCGGCPTCCVAGPRCCRPTSADPCSSRLGTWHCEHGSVALQRRCERDLVARRTLAERHGS